MAQATLCSSADLLYALALKRTMLGRVLILPSCDHADKLSHLLTNCSIIFFFFYYIFEVVSSFPRKL